MTTRWIWALGLACLGSYGQLALARKAEFPPLPQAPHGGKILEAVATGKHDDKVERMYFEVVKTKTNDSIKVYPYILVPRQVPSFLKVAPNVELKDVTLTDGTRVLSVTTDKTAITAGTIPSSTAGPLKISVTYKSEKREAEIGSAEGIPLEKLSE